MLAENELYRRLFDALKSLAHRKEMLRVASSVHSWITHASNSLAAYITDDWSTLVTIVG